MLGDVERPIKFSFREKAKHHLRALTRSYSGSRKNFLEIDARSNQMISKQKQEEDQTPTEMANGTAKPPHDQVAAVPHHRPQSLQIPPLPPEEGAASQIFVPEEFKCPISGETMADPVILASGQSYERSCIQAWFAQGCSECYKTKIPLEHQVLIPNVALKTTILNFSEYYGVPKPEPVSASRAKDLVKCILEKEMENGEEEEKKCASSNQERLLGDELGKSVVVSPVRYVHSASGATLRTEMGEISTNFRGGGVLPHTLDTNPCSLRTEDQNQVPSEVVDPELVEELVIKLKNRKDDAAQKSAVVQVRSLARDGASNRRILCQVDLVEALVGLLQSPYPEIVVNSVAAILNLSLETDNKLKIVRAGAMPMLVHALKSSEAEVQEHAAGAIFSLALHEDNRLAIGVLGAIPPLIDVLRNSKQQPRAQQDASMALYYLSLAQLNRSKMVKAGLVPILLNMAEEGKDLASRGMCILSCLAVSSDGRTALLENNGVTRLFSLLSRKSEDDSSTDAELNEHIVATLLLLSHHNIRFKHLALQVGGLDILVSLLDKSTPRAKEKIVTLLGILKDPPSGVNSPSSGSIEPYFPRNYVRRSVLVRSEFHNGMKAESSHF